MTFRSPIGREIVIDDGNWRQFAPPPGQFVNGMGRGWVPRDFARHPLGSYGAVFDQARLIPREEWYERAVELERTKSRLSDVAQAAGVKVKSQGKTSYCWINGPTFACEVMRAVQGQQYVPLSPASGGAKIKNFRNQGGWGDAACRWIAERGLVPVSHWPANAIDRRYDTPEAWQLAEPFVLEQWAEMPSDSLDHLFSCVLTPIPVPVGYSWWHHLVCAMDAVVLQRPTSLTDRGILAAFALRIANSWGEGWGENGFGILKGSRLVPDGQCAVRAMRVTQ